MLTKKRIPYMLAGLAGVLVALMLSPLVAPTGQYKPFIFGLPYTVTLWGIGSLILATLGVALGIWALRNMDKE